MDSSIRILWIIGLLEVALAFVAPPPTKVELVNVSLDHLDSAYVQQFDSYLTFFKISRSRIGEIEEKSFDSLAHLNLLEISDTELGAAIQPQTFSRLPGLEILVLRNVGLHRVNLNLTHVQEVVLAENELDTVAGIEGENVNYLDVSNNKLSALKNSFEGLKKLSTIDISRNEIAEIENAFERNVNLQTILASENRINSTVGLKLPWLRRLDLFDNRIAVLDSESLAKMKALEELVLAFNKIKRLDDPFKDLLELKFLNLAWNHIEQLDPGLFRNNLYLNKLSVQGNKLKNLERFSSVHPHLTQLDLSHNEIALIDDDFFLSMPSMQVLDLSFNRLKVITDMLAPLHDLRVLSLAYNGITLSGYEFSKNFLLSRVNLSANGLEANVADFRNNRHLTHLDLSHNEVSNICDENTELPAIRKVNLRGNHIHDLSCLGRVGFKSLCEVDLRNNPLTCGTTLDAFILEMANRKASPYSVTSSYQSDLQNQCESLSLKTSFDLWNSVKRELCPGGRDLEAGGAEETEWESSQAPKEVAAETVDLRKEPVIPKATESTNRHFIVVPIGSIGKENEPQSERASWEKIDENAELLKELDEEEEEAEPVQARYSWYTIALVLIGLSLTLTCFNLVVFLYIRMKVWKKANPTSPQNYTILHNEVYKNTTEPSKISPETESDWSLENQTRNKIFSFGRMNELLLNFGLQKKKEGDSESVQNILIGSSTAINHSQSC